MSDWKEELHNVGIYNENKRYHECIHVQKRKEGRKTLSLPQVEGEERIEKKCMHELL